MRQFSGRRRLHWSATVGLTHCRCMASFLLMLEQSKLWNLGHRNVGMDSAGGSASCNQSELLRASLFYVTASKRPRVHGETAAAISVAQRHGCRNTLACGCHRGRLQDVGLSALQLQRCGVDWAEYYMRTSTGVKCSRVMSPRKRHCFLVATRLIAVYAAPGTCLASKLIVTSGSSAP